MKKTKRVQGDKKGIRLTSAIKCYQSRDDLRDRAEHASVDSLFCRTGGDDLCPWRTAEMQGG